MNWLWTATSLIACFLSFRVIRLVPSPMTHIAIAGGIYHDFEGTTAVLRQSIETRVLRLCLKEPDGALKALAAAPECRMLTVDALVLPWRRMRNMRRSEASGRFRCLLKAEKSSASRARRRTLLGLHTASICFDDWAEWRCIRGAQWRWDTSHHPAAVRVSVEVIDANEPLTAGAHPFELFDEVHHNLDMEPTARPLLRARVHEQSFIPSCDHIDMAVATSLRYLGDH